MSDERRRPLIAVVIAWAMVALPGLMLGFFADDWFQLRPRSWQEIIATFFGDWNTGAMGVGGFYRPLTRVSFAVEQSLFGVSSVASHATNALVFLALLLGVYRVALLLTKGHRWSSAIATMLLAFGPLKNEALYWVSARADLLAAAFGLWAVWGALRAIEREDARHIITCALALIGAMLSKEVGVAAAVATTIAVFLMRPVRSWRAYEVVFAAMPIILLLAYLLVRQRALGGIGGYYGARAEPLAMAEVLRNLGRMLSALFSPSAGVVRGAFFPYGGYAWIAAAGIFLVLSKLYRPYVLAVLCVLVSIAPMGGLLISPYDGTRTLILAQGFQTLLVAVFFSRISEKPIIATLVTPTLCAMFLWNAAVSIYDFNSFRRATAPTRGVINAAESIVASLPSGSRVLMLDPADPQEGRRILVPGMAMLMAMQTRAALAEKPTTLEGIEMILSGSGRVGDAPMPPALDVLRVEVTNGVRHTRFFAGDTFSLLDEARALAPAGYFLPGSAFVLTSPAPSPAGLLKVRITGKGEPLSSPRIECKGEDGSVVGAASFILTRKVKDEWEFTAYVMTVRSSGVFVLYPTTTPVRFSLLSLDVSKYQVSSDFEISINEGPLPSSPQPPVS